MILSQPIELFDVYPDAVNMEPVLALVAADHGRALHRVVESLADAVYFVFHSTGDRSGTLTAFWALQKCLAAAS